jgi:hypothetical protein
VINTVVDLIGYPSNFMGTSYTVTTGVTPGLVYTFLLKAKNIYGFAASFSSIAGSDGQIKASDAALAPNAVTVTRSLSDSLKANIYWDIPYLNSEPITGY